MKFVFRLRKQKKGKTKPTESGALAPDIKACATHALIDRTSSVYFLLNTARPSVSQSVCVWTLQTHDGEAEALIIFWLQGYGKYGMLLFCFVFY